MITSDQNKTNKKKNYDTKQNTHTQKKMYNVQTPNAGVVEYQYVRPS